jgi:hypothetical protein
MNNCPFTINFITPHFFYLSYLSLIHRLPTPASSLADRAPPCGGIAHPQGSQCMARTAAARGCSVCPPLIFLQGLNSQRDENPAGFRPPQGHAPEAMPGDGGPKTRLAADSDETGQPSAQTLLLRDFRRRAFAFLDIASGARDPAKEFCFRQNSGSKPAKQS